MKNEKKILALGFVGLIAGLYISISTTFVVLLLGILIAPPVLALASTIGQGIPIISKKFKE